MAHRNHLPALLEATKLLSRTILRAAPLLAPAHLVESLASLKAWRACRWEASLSSRELPRLEPDP